MRRKLLIVLLAGLALPAAAFAGTRSLSGDVDPVGRIEFTSKVDSAGHTVKVKRGLKFRGVRIRCDSGRTRIHGTFHTPIPVAKRQFSATGTYDGGGKVTVAGTFTHHGKRAFGTIKVSGNFTLPDPNLTNCHASHTWHAKH